MKDDDLILISIIIIIGFLIYKNSRTTTLSSGNTANLDSCGCNNP